MKHDTRRVEGPSVIMIAARQLCATDKASPASGSGSAEPLAETLLSSCGSPPSEALTVHDDSWMMVQWMPMDGELVINLTIKLLQLPSRQGTWHQNFIPTNLREFRSDSLVARKVSRVATAGDYWNFSLSVVLEAVEDWKQRSPLLPRDVSWMYPPHPGMFPLLSKRSSIS